jgi:HEAT repeat protein
MSVLPVDARVEMLRDAVLSGDQNLGAVILRAVRDRSPRVRATAAELIGEHKNELFLDSLHELLFDPSGLVRSEAIQALGVIEEGSGRHYEDLISRLRDKKSIVRIAAIESLAQLRDFEAISEIESSLEDHDSLVRAYAAIALAELGCSSCLPRILGALALEREDTATAGFLVAIRLLGEATKFTTLLALLDSNQYQVRCFVANWLPRLELTARELSQAKVSVEEALSHPLARADSSTMSRVLELL